jgi:hypothetical protein
MKRFLPGLVLIISSLAGVQAQEVNFGVEAGINRSSMAMQHEGQKTKAGMMHGFKAGAIADIRFDDMFSIQPGLFYSTKGCKTSGDNYPLQYVELPANLQFRFPLGPGHFFSGGGPYLSYLLNEGTLRDSGSEAQQATNPQQSVDLKPLDMGLNLNAGYIFRGNLFFRTNAGFGFSNLKPTGNSDNCLRNFSLGFTLGYIFSK